jgi:hypothetical protein
VHVPGALDSVIKLEMFNTITEFLERSHAWNTSFSMPVSAGVSEYDVSDEVPSGARIAHLLVVLYPTGGTVPAKLTLPATIGIATAPSFAETYTVHVSFTATDPVDAEGVPVVPSAIIERYLAGIVDGTLSRLFMQPAKPYTSETLGIFHGRKFSSAVAQAHTEAQRRWTYGTQAWRFPGSYNISRGRNR